ncbi:MAG: Gx transporter family protein [Clostridium sp.]|nr:Gx transporter family protein [Clostridium sp.]MCM1207293.1 Gx transporter family protein [Ruminococcus sp.]
MEKHENKNYISAKSNNRMVALTGVFIALALVLSYLEGLIPVFAAVPGVKLGMANIVTMLAMYKLGVKPAIVISAGRIVLSGILFGNLYVIIYSLAGATLSICIMIILKKVKLFSVVGVSVAGAVAHNAGQIIVAVFLMENVNIMYYLPVLIISGVAAGIVVGILTVYIIRNIRI